LARLAELLDLSAAETEDTLAKLASSKMVYAKIDRPSKQVSFVQPKSIEQTLNDWSSDVSRLMVRCFSLLATFG
jgi:26S proteasome regulatory subunit N5